MSTDKVTREVNVTTLVEPAFLTLTKKPANQVGFKIVRDDKEQEMAEPNPEIRVKRVRAKRSMGPMMSVVFPAGTTEEQAKTKMDEYGLSGYTITTEDTGIVAMRSDLTELPARTISIGIGDGVKAIIERTDAPAGEKENIAVVEVRFQKDYYPEESEIMAWLERHDIDFLENGVKNGDTVTTVCRAEVAEGTETREIEADDGVIFVVSRADVMDIPSSFVEVVSETAYGSWGWGQLDFAAAMADKEFSSVAHDAIYTLRDVLDQILFYSPLPVAVRKELMTRAATQFATYVGSLLDALPTKVVLATRSIHESKESDMSNKKEEQVQRSEEQIKAPAAPATEAPAATAEYVTRSELADIVANAVKEALAANVQRSEETPPAAESAGPATTTDPLEVVTRSMADLTKTMQEMASTVNERLVKIEGATVVRSDEGDGKSVKGDIFKGMFGGKRA